MKIEAKHTSSIQNFQEIYIKVLQLCQYYNFKSFRQSTGLKGQKLIKPHS